MWWLTRSSSPSAPIKGVDHSTPVIRLIDRACRTIVLYAIRCTVSPLLADIG